MPVEDIAIRVERPVRAATPSTHVLALLGEIASHLRILLEQGESHAIDLRALPLLSGEREALLAALGNGEVNARVTALGEAEIRETAYPGVWRVEHRDERGEVVAQLIEVTLQPAMLATHPVDARRGLKCLQEMIAAPVPPDQQAKEP